MSTHVDEYVFPVVLLICQLGALLATGVSDLTAIMRTDLHRPGADSSLPRRVSGDSARAARVAKGRCLIQPRHRPQEQRPNLY